MWFKLGRLQLDTLSAQGDSLRRTQGKLDAIEAHTAEANWRLVGMKSIGGAIWNFFSGKPTPKETPIPEPARPRESVDSPPVSAISSRTSAPTHAVSGRHAQLVEEQDRALAAIEESLDRMTVKAKSLGHEVDRQNGMLDSMSGQMGKAEVGMRKAQRTMKTVH